MFCNSEIIKVYVCVLWGGGVGGGGEGILINHIYSDRQLWSNSVDSHQTSTERAFWSGSTCLQFHHHNLNKYKGSKIDIQIVGEVW